MFRLIALCLPAIFCAIGNLPQVTRILVYILPMCYQLLLFWYWWRGDPAYSVVMGNWNFPVANDSLLTSSNLALHTQSFGYLAAIVSLASIVSPLIHLRYQLAIPLSSSDKELEGLTHIAFGLPFIWLSSLSVGGLRFRIFTGQSEFRFLPNILCITFTRVCFIWIMYSSRDEYRLFLII